MDSQTMITQILVYRARKIIGGILLVIAFFILAGTEYTVLYTEENFIPQVGAAFVLGFIGTKLSQIFKWQYVLDNSYEFIGCISYSFKEHSWIKVVSYRSDDCWLYRTCTKDGITTSKPKRNSSGFLGFLWYQL